MSDFYNYVTLLAIISLFQTEQNKTEKKNKNKGAKFPHSPIHHYTSIYGALLFSVSPVRCTCIIKYGAVRKFFQ